MNYINENIRKADLMYLIDHTSIQFSFVDRDYIYRVVNKAYIKNFNKSLDQIIGKNVAELLGNAMFDNIAKPRLDRALMGETVEYEAWFEFPYSQRSYKFVRYIPAHNNNGEIIGVVVSATDMTERKQLEEDRVFYEKLMLNQSRMAQIGEMIAFIAHQWRGPLNTLSTYLLRLKMDQNPTSSNSEIFERCETIISSLSDNIEDLYNFYSLKDTKHTRQLNSVANQAVSLLQHRISAENVVVKIDIPDDCTVDHDRSHLLHIFIVFLENAIDALHQTSQLYKQITIEAKCNATEILIDIHDNGNGISSDIAHCIFDAGVTTKSDTSHGHGLYFAHKIITNYLAGSIEILPSEEGAWFRIKIPK